MTVTEFIQQMLMEFGDDFNWSEMKPDMFVSELITELGEDDDFVLGRKVIAQARCESCDDMLFCSQGSDGSEKWCIYHLTFSHCREKLGFPRKREFKDKKSALEYIRESFIEDYL